MWPHHDPAPAPPDIAASASSNSHRGPVTLAPSAVASLVIDLIDKASQRSPRFGQVAVFLPIHLFPYFRVFIHDSQLAFSQGLDLWLSADFTAVGLPTGPCNLPMHTGCHDRNDAPTRAAGRRSSNAMWSAARVRSSSTRRSSAQPITRREKASITTARYMNSASNRMYVISATQSWLMPLSGVSSAKFRINPSAVIGIGGDHELPLPNA